MYFVNGWPKVFSLGEIKENILEVKYNFDGTLIAITTETTISIWSGDQHRILLGSFVRQAAFITREGLNRQITWKKDSTSIALSTTNGYVLVFLINSSPQSKLLQYKFDQTHHYIELAQKVAVHLAQLHQILIPHGGATCISGDGEKIFIGTNEGYLFTMLWSGKLHDILFLRSVFPPTSPSHTDTSTLSCITYSEKLKVFGLIFSDGRGGFIETVTGGKLRGEWLRKKGSVCIDINSQHRLIAIGCENGKIKLLPLTKDQTSRKLSLYTWGIDSKVTGAVQQVQWTHDGCALAVGWKKRGLSVWSIYGCRLMCTIPQLEGSVPRSSSSSYHEPLRDGVSTIAWGPEGYHCLVADTVTQGQFLQFSFLRSCPNMNCTERMLLQGEDRILFLCKQKRDPSDLSWDHHQIPQTYLADNWPMKLVSPSKDGTHWAVSGRRGFTIYNSISNRWKLFGDRYQEQAISCCALCWYGENVIVANHSQDPEKYEILIYPRTYLSNTVLLHRSDIPRQPVFLDCNDRYLIILTADSFFYQYLITVSFQRIDPNKGEEITSIKLTLVHQISMASITSHITSFLLLPQEAPLPSRLSSSNLKNLYSVESSKCLLLHSSGVLSLANLDDQGLQITMASSVEQFWFGANTFSQKDLGNTLWAYGEIGVQVWFPFLDSEDMQAMRLMSRDKSLEFDLEVYPIGS
eukprot:TRINITY_DN2119_c0_g1_i1.p1 TRINITY_DN2119_c0_g1~~TRINITY_DN2119_c0_g1_i1.p1  ORF type:complete len:690 (+),score=78.40 TRINITY_DN2119_c0_g1_i1:37-2106(+)